MAVEAGAPTGIIAPDNVTFDYLQSRPQAPKGSAWGQALAYWRTLPTDEGAAFDQEHRFAAETIAPSVTWGPRLCEKALANRVVGL
jgi:homoaconitase/3-isopropylmalate dehydratase large subunit